jgi:hypothetical protein
LWLREKRRERGGEEGKEEGREGNEEWREGKEESDIEKDTKGATASIGRFTTHHKNWLRSCCVCGAHHCGCPGFPFS